MKKLKDPKKIAAGKKLATMIALVGLGFTAFDLFLRYKSQTASTGEKPLHEFTSVETISPPKTKSDQAPRHGME